jgi:hypothetical protein
VSRALKEVASHAARVLQRPLPHSDLEALAILKKVGKREDGRGFVYRGEQSVRAMADAYLHTDSAEVRARALPMLSEAFRASQADPSDYGAGLRYAITEALTSVHGSGVLREVLRATGGDKEVAYAIFHLAEVTDQPNIRAAKGAPVLNILGINGAGTKMMVVERSAGHGAPVCSLADPEGSKVSTHVKWLQNPGWETFPGLVVGVREALEEARRAGIDVFNLSNGTWWDRVREDYVRMCGGDEGAAWNAYQEHLDAVDREIKEFDGLVIMAAGNEGWHGPKNDLARNKKVLVAASLNANELHNVSSSANAWNTENLLGVGTTAYAYGADGKLFQAKHATSFAAPQISYFAACVFQAARSFGQSPSGQHVKAIMLRTPEPLAQRPYRADVETAVRFAKVDAYLNSIGAEDLHRRLWDLPPARMRDVLPKAWQLLDSPSDETASQIRVLLG